MISSISSARVTNDNKISGKIAQTCAVALLDMLASYAGITRIR
jgi:hypothetical protein